MKTPIHLVIGQEATSVGCCAALTNDDLLYSSHRTHGNYLAKGGDLRSMLCEMFCRANGCVGSRGGSMHLIDKRVGMAGTSAIVAGAIPIATGAALAAKMKRARHDDGRVLWRGRHRGRRLFGEPEFCRSETTTARVLLREQLLLGASHRFGRGSRPRSLRKWAEGYRAARGGGRWHERAGRLRSSRATRSSGRETGGRPTFIEAVCYRVPRAWWIRGRHQDRATAPRTSGTRGIRSTRCLCTFSTLRRAQGC